MDGTGCRRRSVSVDRYVKSPNSSSCCPLVLPLDDNVSPFSLPCDVNALYCSLFHLVGLRALSPLPHARFSESLSCFSCHTLPFPLSPCLPPPHLPSSPRVVLLVSSWPRLALVLSRVRIHFALFDSIDLDIPLKPNPCSYRVDHVIHRCTRSACRPSMVCG